MSDGQTPAFEVLELFSRPKIVFRHSTADGRRPLRRLQSAGETVRLAATTGGLVFRFWLIHRKPETVASRSFSLVVTFAIDAGSVLITRNWFLLPFRFSVEAGSIQHRLALSFRWFNHRWIRLRKDARIRFDVSSRCGRLRPVRHDFFCVVSQSP